MTWQFDARQVAPDAGFELWPEGMFPVMIVKVEEKPIKETEGFAWHLTIKGLDGPVKDKTTEIQIANRSNNAQRNDIATKTMSAIMHVTNVLTFDHPMRLQNIPFYVKSAHRAGKGDNAGKTYQDWPEFRNTNGETALAIYQRLNGIAPAGGAAQQPQQQQAPAGFGQPQQPSNPAGGFVQQQQPVGFGTQPPQSAPGFPVDGNGQPLQQQQQPAMGGGAWPAANGPQPGAVQQQPTAGFVQQQQQPAPGAWPQGQPTQPQQQMQPQPGFVQGGQPQNPGAAPWNGPTQ